MERRVDRSMEEKGHGIPNNRKDFADAVIRPASGSNGCASIGHLFPAGGDAGQEKEPPAPRKMVSVGADDNAGRLGAAFEDGRTGFDRLECVGRFGVGDDAIRRHAGLNEEVSHKVRFRRAEATLAPSDDKARRLAVRACRQRALNSAAHGSAGLAIGLYGGAHDHVAV